MTRNIIRDYTYKHGISSNRVHQIVFKSIEDVNKSELAYLLRENQFTEVVIEISIEILANEKIEIYPFDHSSNSDEQRELIRELLLVQDEYWNLNPKGYKRLKDLIVNQINIIKIPNFIISHFLNYKPEMVSWDENDEEWYRNMIMDNSASTVLTAFEKIRKIVRSIVIGNKIHVKLNNETMEINSIAEFENIIVKNLPMYKDLVEFLYSEKEYKTKR